MNLSEYIADHGTPLNMEWLQTEAVDTSAVEVLPAVEHPSDADLTLLPVPAEEGHIVVGKPGVDCPHSWTREFANSL